MWNEDGSHRIIALHGWQDNANTFDRLAPLMPPNASVLALDIPGHGLSSHYPKGFPYHRISYVVTLRRIVNYLGWNKVSLMGHSLGGQICHLYSSIYPEEVDALITLDMFVTLALKGDTAIRRGKDVIDEFLRRDQQSSENSPTYLFEELVGMVVRSHVAPIGEEAVRTLLLRGTESVGDGKYRLLRDPKVKGFATTGWSAKELLNFCRDLKMNVLCVKAESAPFFGGKEFFEEAWEVVAKVAKHAEFHYVPGGHHVHLENADVVAPIVNDFLQHVFSSGVKD